MNACKQYMYLYVYTKNSEFKTKNDQLLIYC